MQICFNSIPEIYLTYHKNLLRVHNLMILINLLGHAALTTVQF